MPSKPRSAASRLCAGGTRVDDNGQPELGGELEVGVEEAALGVVRRVVPVVVEPRLSDRDRTVVLEQVAKLLDTIRLRPSCLVRVDAERGEDTRLLVARKRERGAARVDPRADRDHPRHAGRARTRQRFVRRAVERVEMRVGVDHDVAARAGSMRGKSGAAGAMPVASRRRPGATSSHDVSDGWPSASRIAEAVTGRYE